MVNDMNIKLTDLRKVTERLLLHLEQVAKDDIELDVDYYWSIDQEQRYSVNNEPNDFSIGQLTDDWKSLVKMINEEHGTISYELVWLSSIFQAIGEKIVH